MREEKKCEWNEWTSTEAAKHGNVEMVKYRVANECPIDAAWHLESLKYSHGVLTYTLPLSDYALFSTLLDADDAFAARTKGHLECLCHAIEKKRPGWEECVNELKEMEKEMWRENFNKHPKNRDTHTRARKRFQEEISPL